VVLEDNNPANVLQCSLSAESSGGLRRNKTKIRRRTNGAPNAKEHWRHPVFLRTEFTTGGIATPPKCCPAKTKPMTLPAPAGIQPRIKACTGTTVANAEATPINAIATQKPPIRETRERIKRETIMTRIPHTITC
jgi:hypothetical protein